VAAIITQLTKNLSLEQIEGTPFATYFVDHTNGAYPVSAAGVPFDMKYVGIKGDIITDLHEDLAADATILHEQLMKFAEDTFLLYRKETPEVPMSLFIFDVKKFIITSKER
jgi:spore coat protein JC